MSWLWNDQYGKSCGGVRCQWLKVLKSFLFTSNRTWKERNCPLCIDGVLSSSYLLFTVHSCTFVIINWGSSLFLLLLSYHGNVKTNESCLEYDVFQNRLYLIGSADAPKQPRHRSFFCFRLDLRFASPPHAALNSPDNEKRLNVCRAG